MAETITHLPAALRKATVAIILIYWLLVKLQKDWNGLQVIRYIFIKERIELAKQLMSNPYNSISEVCFKISFNKLNYFSRALKKQRELHSVHLNNI
jgi:AraC-like DNA-binding protein